MPVCRVKSLEQGNDLCKTTVAEGASSSINSRKVLRSEKRKEEWFPIAMHRKNNNQKGRR